MRPGLSRTRFDGTPLRSASRPFRVWWDPHSASRDLGDFPGFPEPVLSGRAVAALGADLRHHGDLLELISDDGEFYLHNVTDVVDAIDKAAFHGERFPSSGRWMFMQKRVCIFAALVGHEIFRIPQMPSPVPCGRQPTFTRKPATWPRSGKRWSGGRRSGDPPRDRLRSGPWGSTRSRSWPTRCGAASPIRS